MNGNKNNPPSNPFMCESESDGGFLVSSYFRSVLPDSRYDREQIKNTDAHDGNGSDLRLHPVGYDTHEEREDRSSKQAHDHQPDTSFLRFGRWSRAREKSMEKMFELPNPTKAIHT